MNTTLPHDQQARALELLSPLTEGERLAARQVARENVVKAYGERPTRAQYRDTVASDYPRWLTVGVGLMLFIVFFAAANVSVFRVFTAGRDHFMQTIPIDWQASVVGASSFLLAEFMVIAATVAMRLFFKGRDRWLMAIPILLGLAVAFVGNWAIANPIVEFSAPGLWGLLETATPPAAVLFMAIIGERLILEALRNRRANERMYQVAAAEYDALTANPESAPRWPQALANAYREALVRANSAGRGATERRELMARLTVYDWRELVGRELANDEWWSEPARPTMGQQAPSAQQLQASPVAPMLTSPNGNHNGNGNGLH